MTVKRGRVLAIAIYLAIAALATGGLAWTTWQVLQLERQAAELELAKTVRLALWRLDSRIFPVLAREDSRPVSHYEPLYAPIPALDQSGKPVKLGAVFLPSPLLSAELPDWLSLHFVVDPKYGWRSPEVPDDALQERLKATPSGVSIINATAARRQHLQELSTQMPIEDWFGESKVEAAKQLAQAPEPSQPAPGRSRMPQVANAPGAEKWLQDESQARGQQQVQVLKEGKNYDGNNPAMLNRVQTEMLFKESATRAFTCSCANDIKDMAPQWRHGRDDKNYLLFVRDLEADGLPLKQGVALDWTRLRTILLEQINDLLPNARLEQATENDDPGFVMKALPVVLTTGEPPATMFPSNSPLRWGLAVAWGATLLALGVVGLTGWSLLDLSERRFRFVTAVTHELRTPLTTLRLYLDMLTGGMVREEKQRGEYLQTLHGEADRLHRLIGNVLDYARLERQQPVINRQAIAPQELINTIRAEWEGHCKSANKELTLDVASDLPMEFTTDPDLCRQLLGNLIDNACKYSNGAADPRIWLRATADRDNIRFEVEDRGPGVPQGESRSVFSAFRRGHDAPTTAGGVGLGLALATRWAKLLGGELTLKPGNGGACFQFSHPIS